MVESKSRTSFRPDVSRQMPSTILLVHVVACHLYLCNVIFVGLLAFSVQKYLLFNECVRLASISQMSVSFSFSPSIFELNCVS